MHEYIILKGNLYSYSIFIGFAISQKSCRFAVQTALLKKFICIDHTLAESSQEKMLTKQ
jgi:hypothetical protein